MIRASCGSSRRSHSSRLVRQDDNSRQPETEPPREEEPPMEPSMTCMVVVENGPDIAFACYVEERNEILVEACRASDDTEGIVERFTSLARPTLVLVSAKSISNASFVEMITKPPPELPDESTPASSSLSQSLNASERGIMPSTRSIPYRVLKTGAFELRTCKSLILQKLRVLSLRYQGDHIAGYVDPNRSQRNFPLPGPYASFRPSSYHSLAAIVDFDSKVQVQALGALLSFLQTTIFQLEENKVVTVNRIVQARSSLCMQINASTFASLHIFATEHHPLIAKGPGNAKEGFSLYSLLDRTQSKGGRQLLREWMLKPLVDLQAIRERQDAVELFIRPQLQTSAGVLLNLLTRIGPVDKILTRMQKCTTNPLDFLTLAKTLEAASAVRDTLRNNILSTMHPSDVQSIQFLHRIAERCFAPSLAELHQRIISVVDELATKELKTSVVIRCGFDKELDAMKDDYEELELVMESVGAEIQHEHPELHLSVVFVPQVGFLVALDKNSVLEQVVELPQDFCHIFNQDDEAFFKTRQTRELDNDIGDLDGLIKDTESMIVTELEETVLDTEAELRESFKAMSELDCILAFAECAVDFHFVRPHMLEATANRIHVVEGRHPLQEIITERAFVPNDIHIDSNSRVTVVTGPNYSGKSCYLRQVGILVYMAHIGSFIPCTSAEISIVDQIAARISTVETCAVPQSSFQLDLTQMASILLKCSSNSLVLIDEFGKGTSPASGIAILGAAIKRLSQIGCKAICTTHFLELFSMNIIEEGTDNIKARQMSIQLPDGEDGEAIPMFKLEDGVASSSAGLICAKKAGVNPWIIARAKHLILSMRGQVPLEPCQEALPSNANLTMAERETLDYLSEVENWEVATDDNIRQLIHKIAQIES